MSKKIKDGCASSERTLRDEFAIAALRELIAKSPLFTNNTEVGIFVPDDELEYIFKGVSISAYRYADAMLAAREGKK